MARPFRLILPKVGRPTKQTEKFIKIAKEIIENDINAIILTDEELVFLINEKLENKEKATTISQTEFPDERRFTSLHLTSLSMGSSIHQRQARITEGANSYLP